MKGLNVEGLGEPIAKIVVNKTSKRQRNSKYKTISNPHECQYCFKQVTPGNKARHFKICTVKKAGGSCKLICVMNDQKCVKEPLNKIVTKDNEIVQQIPNKKKERKVYYISGQSGSGKSYYMNKLADKYHSMYPKNNIYLFSLLTDDKSITTKKIKRIKLDDNFLNTDLTLQDMKNSLIIYDDVDTIKHTQMKSKLFRILDTLLQTGRHSSTSVIYCSHLPCNGIDTKIILNECNSLTIFPSTMGNRTLRYLLGEYFGLDNNQIKQIKKLDSRHITIIRTYPMVLLYEKGAFVLNLDED